MRLPSSKTFVIAGFAISLASVAMNAIVLSGAGARLKAVDSEYYAVDEALRKQAALLGEADLKFDVYRVMHHVASSHPAITKDAREDAQQILQGFLVKFYAAANDVPPIEVTRIAMDEATEYLPRLQRSLELLQAMQRTADNAERARMAMELQQLGEDPPPKSELAGRLREIGRHAGAEKEAADGLELTYRLFPVMKSLTDQLTGSIRQKEERLRALQRERSALAQKQAYASYAAVSLQIFGLMFFFARDFLRTIVKEE